MIVRFEEEKVEFYLNGDLIQVCKFAMICRQDVFPVAALCGCAQTLTILNRQEKQNWINSKRIRKAEQSMNEAKT